MNPQLQETLNALAIKLGTTVERIYPMVIAKIKLDAWVYISVGIILTSLSIIGSGFCFKKWLGKDDDNDYAPGAWILIVLSVLASMFIWCNISDIVYPEVSAFHYIASMVK